MSGLGFWKRDYVIMDNDDDYNDDEYYNDNNENDILLLEEMVIDLYERLKSKQSELCIDVFDDLELLDLRDWLSYYIPDVKLCFE